MTNNTWQLKQLFYENMGSAPFYLRKFEGVIAYLDEPFSGLTRRVIQLLTGDLHACDGFCRDNSRIEATVQLHRTVYTVRVLFRASVANFYVADDRKRDRTLWYMQNMVHTSEEQELSCFSKPGAYPVRLHQYKDPVRRYPGDLREATCSIGSTRSFRDHLRHFIRNFPPKRLLPDKNYFLQLEADGRFVVRLGIDGQPIPHLSETEYWLYHYLCFLHLLDFWDGMQDLRNAQAVKLPLLIQDFSRRLDTSIAAADLFAQAKPFGRQVLIFQ